MTEIDHFRNRIDMLRLGVVHVWYKCCGYKFDLRDFNILKSKSQLVEFQCWIRNRIKSKGLIPRRVNDVRRCPAACACHYAIEARENGRTLGSSQFPGDTLHGTNFSIHRSQAWRFSKTLFKFFFSAELYKFKNKIERDFHEDFNRISNLLLLLQVLSS